MTESRSTDDHRLTVIYVEGPLFCDPQLQSADPRNAQPHTYEVIDQEYDSLGNGGSYDVLRCKVCGRTAYSPLPD